MTCLRSPALDRRVRTKPSSAAPDSSPPHISGGLRDAIVCVCAGVCVLGGVGIRLIIVFYNVLIT